MSNVKTDTVRYTIEFARANHAKLNDICDEFKITQPEAIGVILENMDTASMADKFRAVREAKLKARAEKREIISKFRSMTPEQLAAMEAAAVKLL